jgi:hypothetical protein
MSDAVPFLCPNCAHPILIAGANPQSYDELLGAVCERCAHIVTEDEIHAQAMKVADHLLDTWRRAG